MFETLIIKATQLFTDIITYINTISGDNEFVAGAIVAVLVGSITYTARALPQKFFRDIVKQTTTTLQVNSTNDSYHSLSKYLSKGDFIDKTRYIKIGNGRYGESKNIKEIGYGTHLFWFNWYTPLLIKSYKEDTVGDKIKEFIEIIKIGRNHMFFDKMLKEIEYKDEEKDKTKFYAYERFKDFITKQPKRNLDSIILPPKDKKKLLKTIDNFILKEKWYLKYQIPYQLGILLYGAPGTGKTCLIKAIASYMNKDICFVDTESDLIDAAQKVNDSIIVVEEIDTFCFGKREEQDSEEPHPRSVRSKATPKRLSVEKTKKQSDGITNLLNMYDKKILGKVLNALDGIITNHGRIIILTTNHKDVLDRALLRPGRIDIQLEMGCLTVETFNMLLKRFFSDYKNVEVLKIKEKITPVVVQNDIILGLTPEQIIEKYMENSENE